MLRYLLRASLLLTFLFLTACGAPQNALWSVKPADFEIHHTSVALLFSPDGTMVAAAGPNEVLLLDAATGEQVECFDSGIEGARGGSRDIAFSPDSQFIAIHDNDAIRIWEIDKEPNPLCGGAAEFGIDAPNTDAEEVVFSQDGSRLYVAWHNSVNVYDTESEDLLMELTGHDDRVYCLAASPDGRFIASGGQGVIVWDAVTGENLWTAKGICENGQELVFTPDSTTLIVTYAARTYDAVTGEETEAYAGVSGSDIAFSPDGTLYVRTGHRGPTVLDVLGAEVFQFEGHRETIWAVDFAPDGKHVASLDESGRVIVWVLPEN